MAFGGEGRAVALLLVDRTDPELEPELVDGAVEHHVVIGHVEMAVIVDPLRLDLHYRRKERRGPEQHIIAGGNTRHSVHSARSISILDPLYILCHGIFAGRISLAHNHNQKLDRKSVV